MYKESGIGIVCVVIACLALQVTTTAAWGAMYLMPSQILKPADLSPDEMAFYNSATDPAVKRDFILTRSYVRAAQALVDQKIPASDFPCRTPEGYSVKYLLPSDPTLVNQAVRIAVTAKMTACWNDANCGFCDE